MLNMRRSVLSCTLFIAQEMKFPIKGFFSNCDKICWKLRIWSHLLKKSLMKNFIFCAVIVGGGRVEKVDIFEKNLKMGGIGNLDEGVDNFKKISKMFYKR